MSKKDNTGLIHIYCGDGKGKTTAAVGLSVRCAGRGGKVLFFQFLKGDKSGERHILELIDGIDVEKGAEIMKFVWNMTDEEKSDAKDFYAKKFDEICEKSSGYDMLVLDEIIPSLKYNFVTLDRLMLFLKTKPRHLEVILTGRDPDEKLIEIADYVTEMKKIKHPFDLGITMREYVEI